MRQTVLTFSLLALAACAPDLRTDFPFDGALPDGTYFVFEDEGGGSTRVTVDATNKSSYVYLDLDTMTELSSSAALAGGGWDLSFQRFKVSSNGGGGGPGPVAIAVLTGQTEGSYDALTKAPADGYVQDAADPVLTTAEGGWYTYDLSIHKLVPRPDLLYVVHASADGYFKVKMLSYYDDNGTAARMTLRVGRLTAP